MYRTYSYHYYTSSSTVDSGVFVAMLIISLLFAAAFYVIYGIFASKIFKKLGVAPAWAAWVPFYGQWKFMEAGGQQGWWIFVPVANVIFQVIAAYNVGLKFGKEGGWVVLYLFLNPVWLILLGMKDTKPVANPKQMSIINPAS